MLSREEIEKIKKCMSDIKFPSIFDVENLEKLNFNRKIKNEENPELNLKNYYCILNFDLMLNAKVVSYAYKSINQRAPEGRIRVFEECGICKTFIAQYDIVDKFIQIFKENGVISSNNIENIIHIFLNKYYDEIKKEYLMFLKSYNYLNSCDCHCRKGLIANSGINNWIAKFENNFLIYDKNFYNFRAYDNRRIKWLIKSVPLFYNLDGKDEALIIGDVLTELKNDNRNLVQCLFPFPYTRNIQEPKRELMNIIKGVVARKFTADNINQEFKKLDFGMEDARINNLYGIPIKFKWETNSAKGIKNIYYYKNLLKILYVLSDGQKNVLDNIAKLMASCVLGSEICGKFKLKVPQSHVITANNKRFVKEFLLSIFKMGRFEDSSFYSNDYASSYMKLWDYAHKYVSLDQIKQSSLWGISEYSIDQLSNPKMTGKFIEDKLYSIIVNITDDVSDCKDHEYFKKLVTGKTVSYKNEYLGKQELTSDKQYIFIVHNNEEMKKIDIDDSKHIELSQNIQPDIYYFNRDIECTDFEKRFMLIDFAKYGLKLLFKSGSNSENHYNHTEKITNPLTYYIQNCCDVVKVETDINGENSKKEKIQPDETNSTAMLTLGVAYNSFYDIVDPQYKFQNGFNKAFVEKYGFQYKIIKNTRSKAKERDLKNGYSDKEVVKDKGAYCLGLVVKPINEILNIAKQCKSDFEKNTSKFTEEEFVQFIADIGDLHFDEDEYSELIKSSRSI